MDILRTMKIQVQQHKSNARAEYSLSVNIFSMYTNGWHLVSPIRRRMMNTFRFSD